MASAREEAEQVMFGALDILFKNTGVRLKDIGILVVNCSLFNPTPSLSSMIINRYKLRGNILSFNLGGMGCSAGVIAVDLAKDLLRAHRGTYAVVVSTENITQNWYSGNRKSMLIPNCLFRVGGAAMLLSNRPADRFRAKYRLVDVVRTHMGADEKAFRCVYQEQDEKGKTGVSLSRYLMVIAGAALKANITSLGPRVLPLSEKLLFVGNLAVRKVFPSWGVKPYMPDFKVAFEHFCIHAGRRAVIDELEKNLRLGGGQRGSVEDDATPVRQHVVELDLVRAVVHGGQGEGAERGPRVADRLRERVQVQQRRLAGAEEREGFAG